MQHFPLQVSMHSAQGKQVIVAVSAVKELLMDCFDQALSLCKLQQLDTQISPIAEPFQGRERPAAVLGNAS